MDKQLITELIKLINSLTDRMDILCLINSYGDTQDDDEILACLEMLNEGGTYMTEIIAETPESKANRLGTGKQKLN